MRAKLLATLILISMVGSGLLLISEAQASPSSGSGLPGSVAAAPTNLSDFWEQSGYDSEHTSRSPALGPASAGLLWEASPLSDLRFVDPAAGLVQAPDGTLWSGAMDLDSISTAGTVLGKIPVPQYPSRPFSSRYSGSVVGTPAVTSGGFVVAGTSTQGVLASGPGGAHLLNNGHPGRPVLASVATSPVIGPNGDILVEGGTTLYALSSTGRILWSYGGASSGIAPAVSANGTAFVPTGNGNLTALSPAGTLLWTVPLPAPAVASPVVSLSGNVSVSLGAAIVVIGSNGTISHDFALTPSADTGLALGRDGTLYFGAGVSHLDALAPNGTIEWTFDASAAMTVTPSIDGAGSIYFGDSSGVIYSVSSDGILRWSLDVGRAVWTTPIVGANQTLYVGLADNKVVALQAAALHTVTFVANGLPAGDAWTLDVSGSSYTTKAGQVRVQASVSVPITYAASPVACGSGCRFSPVNGSGRLLATGPTTVSLDFEQQFLLKMVAHYGGHSVPIGQLWVSAKSASTISAPTINPYAFVNWTSPSTGVTILNPTSATTSVKLSAPGTLYANYS